MLQKYKKGTPLIPLLQFFFVLLAGYSVDAQIYYHNFGNATFTTYPYTAAPTTLAPNLSNSTWTNSTNAWSSNTGSAGQAIQIFNPAGTSTITLTFNVAPNFQVGVTSFNFWRQRSASGPQAWQMSINGIDVGSGTIPLAGNGTGIAIGNTPVASPVAGLTGTVTVVLTLSGATGAGNIRFDDFTLNGSVTSTCNNAVVTSYAPLTGPKDTMITITGSGFTDTATVKMDGINMPFTVISDTEIQALVPAGVEEGMLVVTATDGCFGEGTTPFTLLETDCQSFGTEIYISQIYDQTPGSYGLIELYNPTNTTVNLAGYTLTRTGSWSGDFGGSMSYTLNMSGSIPPLSTYLVESNNGTPGNCGISPNAYMGSGINDNDGIFLYKNGGYVDSAKTPGNPGYGMIRKPNAIAPDQTYSDADWNIGGQSCANLGAHTGLPSTPPLPLITHPVPRTVCVNANTTFTATFIPATGYTFQWKMLTSAGTWVNVVNNGTYSGATTTTLTINGVQLAMNNNQYYLQATSSPTCVVLTEAAQLFVLDKPAAPTVVVVQQPTCTTPTGTIEITAPLDPDFTYSIDGVLYDTQTVFENLAPGSTHNITVKNIAGCISNVTVQVIGTVPGAPTAPTVDATQPTCTTSTGSLTVTNPVGAGYTYSIDGGPFLPGPTFNGINPGPHTVTVQFNGCTSAATPKTIDPQPATPTAPTVVAGQPTCTDPDGSLTVTSPVGTGYAYSLDGGPFVNGPTFNDVPPGPHNIRVQLNGGCISPQTPKSIDPAPGAPAIPNLVADHPDCTTASGSITVNSPVGADITYSIDGEPFVPGTIFNDVAPGPHTIVAKNAAGCLSPEGTITVNDAPEIPEAPEVTVDHPGCGATTGSITITAPVGAGYTYSLDGGLFLAATEYDNLTSGPHTIVAKNAEGCESPETTENINAGLDVPGAPVLSTEQPDCDTATGTITVTQPVGVGLTYSKNGFDYFPETTFTGLTPGVTYNITVKNSSGCVSPVTSKTIDAQPATPVAPTLAETQPTCAVATGSITVTNPVGAGYTYSIDGLPFVAGTTFNGLAPGPHEIRVQLNGLCISDPASKTISAQPVTPNAPTLAETHPDCDTATGSITVTAPLGAGYTYSIDGGPFVATTTFNLLNPGPHNIRVQLNGECISAPASKTINPQPVTPVAPTLAETHPTCTTATGTITVTNPVGAGYTYSIDGLPFVAGPTFNGLPAGPHEIRVQLNGLCISDPASKTINPQPETPDAPTLSETHPDCDTATGSITITDPVGAGYTYSIDGGAFVPDTTFDILAPGPHSVRVRLNGGCISAPASKTINAQPGTPVAPTLAETHPTCTTATGSITVTNPVGAGYTYSIDGGPFVPGVTFNSLAAGPHEVRVQLNGLCISAPTSKTINAQPATPNAPTLAETHPDCTTATGTITVTNPIGPEYTYSLDGGPFVAGPTFNNVATGPHTVRVQLNGLCISAPASKTINAQPVIPVAPTLAEAHPTCTAATGSITVTNPLGAGYTYSLDGGPFVTTTIFNGLPAGPHNIRVQLNGLCISAPASKTINPQPETPAVPTLTETHPTCTTPTGSITVVAPGAGYTYSLDGGPFVTTTTFNLLAPGPHTVVAKNAAGCTSAAASKTIAPALPVPAVPTLDADHPGCTDTTGTITVIAPVGADITYSLDGAPFVATTTFTVAPGSHTIVAKNGSGCESAPKSQVINAIPSAPDVPVLMPFHPGCNATKGSLTVTSPVGNGFTYSLDGGNYVTANSFANLDPGPHTITVKNAAGCISATVTETINTPPITPDAPEVDIVHPDCTTETGSVTVTSPIEPGMMYNINSLGWETGPIFNDLAPGNYVITSRNAAGCVSAYGHFVINHPPLTAADPLVTVEQPDCDTATGTITVNSPVGVGLEYNIGAGFQPSRIFNNVGAGTYTITVRNSAGCTAELTGVIVDSAPAPAPNPGVITGDSAVCEGGTIQLANTETTGVWGSSNTDIATVDANGLVTALAPGSVTITYTTGTVCTDEATKTIIVHNLPEPTLRDTFLCVDNETGDMIPGLLSSGVTGTAYTYEWARNGTVLPLATSSIIINEPGEYSVKVTNTVTGCEATKTVTVGTSSLALAYADATTDFHFNQTITVHVTGGSGDYEYSIDGGQYQDEPYFSNIYEGEYLVTVRDKNGCGVLELYVYALNYPRFFSPNGDGARDTWNIEGLENQPDAKIFVYDRYGKVIAGFRPGGEGWDGTYNGERLPATDYWFTLEYRSESGSQKEFKAHFSLLR